jgi:hypothetical protein
MSEYLDSDENVKAMRDTARTIGLTQLLIDIAGSPATMAGEDCERVGEALDLLGVTEDEIHAAISALGEDRT